MAIEKMKKEMKEKAEKAEKAKAEKNKIRDGIRSSSSLVQSGRMAMQAHMQAAAAAPPPQPVFSQESQASVAFLAKAISDWHKQGTGDGEEEEGGEGAEAK